MTDTEKIVMASDKNKTNMAIGSGTADDMTILDDPRNDWTHQTEEANQYDEQKEVREIYQREIELLRMSRGNKVLPVNEATTFRTRDD